ncbi:MAG TPA: hypothetical protein DD725_08345 [Deltaproteobacteria bacterium]|nr:hypothetical protein [Deltaproteobacteria bacterium]
MKLCPVCASTITPEFLERCDNFTINRCPDCDVIFSDPMTNPGASWYESSEMYAVGRFCNIDNGWHHKQFLDDAETYGKRLLDVGCGTGVFLKEANKKGYEVCGLDFDKKNVKIAKARYGIENIYTATISGIARDFSGESFDVITFFEVLEHLESPVSFINEIKAILAPGGYIALSLPNRERTLDFLGDADYPPNHLTKWDKECLSSFLERNGFEVVKCLIKELDSNEVVAYLKHKIRFGIAKSIARRGIDSKDERDIQKAAKLLMMKDMLFKIFSIIFKPVSLFSLQGTGLYMLARLKR